MQVVMEILATRMLRRASMNIHDWYGVISNLNVDNGGDITYNVGFDYRTYTGTHFRQIVDLYGLNGYTDNWIEIVVQMTIL